MSYLRFAKKNNIPRTFNRGKTFRLEQETYRRFFCQRKAPNPDITEWYSTQEMQEKFGMTLPAPPSTVSFPRMPFHVKKKSKGIMVYYSKNMWI